MGRKIEVQEATRGEMLKKQVVCLFKMIVDKQKSLLKATGRLIPPLVFSCEKALVWCVMNGDVSLQRTLAGQAEAVLRESICHRERKSFSAHSVNC